MGRLLGDGRLVIAGFGGWPARVFLIPSVCPSLELRTHPQFCESDMASDFDVHKGEREDPSTISHRFIISSYDAISRKRLPAKNDWQ